MMSRRLHKNRSSKRGSSYDYSMLEVRRVLTTLYYVNDTVYDPAVDEYTTVAGSPSNTGLTPDSPRSDIQSILDDYDLDPGSTILVDSGYYPMVAETVFGDQDSGVENASVTIQGPVADGAEAIFDRGDGSDFDRTVFEFDGASYITISNLSVTGANIGFYFPPTQLIENIVIENNDIYGNRYGVQAGLYSTQTDTRDITIRNNRIYDSIAHGISAQPAHDGWRILDNEIYSNDDWGIIFRGGVDGDIRGNVVYDNGIGIVVSGAETLEGHPVVVAENFVFGNDSGISAAASTLVTNNIAHNNRNIGISYQNGSKIIGNEAYNNDFGIGTFGFQMFADEVSGNRAYNNRRTGIIATSEVVTDNWAYSNDVGIEAEGRSLDANVFGNRVYDNETVGIRTQGRLANVYNNSIYEPTAIGIAVYRTSLTTQQDLDDVVDVFNNIVVALDDFAIIFNVDGQRNVNVDYNLYHTPNNAFGNWLPNQFDSLTDWQLATNLDANSLVDVAPGFVDVLGSDNRLGFDRTPIGSPIVVDDGDAGFSTEGTWSTVSDGYLGDTQVGRLVDNKAYWEFVDLDSGVYEIYGTWSYFGSTQAYGVDYIAREAEPVMTGNVSSTIRTASIGFNQNQVSGGFDYDGVSWRLLSTVVVEGSTLTVEASQDVNYFDMLADGILLQKIRGDSGLDADFHISPGSPAIDRGSLDSYFLAEPNGGGGRANLGAYGNTAEAAVTTGASVELLSPNGFERLVLGEEVEVSWRSWGLNAYDGIALMNSGSSDSFEGWLFDHYRTSQPFSGSLIGPVDLSAVVNPAAYPVYQSYAFALDGIGNEVRYELPIFDGDYEVRLHFVNDQDSVGDRQFDIVANGTMVRDDFDIAAEAGAISAATDLSFSVSVTGGEGLTLQLENQTTQGAKISAIEITRPTGVAGNARFELSFSDDDGQNFVPIVGARGLATNIAGRGSYDWTTTTSTSGNVGRIKVAGNPTFVSDASDNGFSIFQPINAYYINDDFDSNDVYTTAAGDDLNSGLSPDSPIRSLSVLFSNYSPSAGDIVYIDNGTYNISTNVVLDLDNSGSLAAPLTIQGPTSGEAILHRGSSVSGNYIFELQGTNNVVFQDLTFTRANAAIFAFHSDSLVLERNLFDRNGSGIKAESGANNYLIRDNFFNQNARGVFVENGGNDLLIESNESINGGVFGFDIAALSFVFQENTISGGGGGGSFEGLGSPEEALVLNNSFSTGTQTGIAATSATVRDNIISGYAQGVFASGTAIIEANQSSSNVRDGIVGSDVVVIRKNVVFNNGDDGIYADGPIVIEGNRAFANTDYGIHSNRAATIRNNHVYDNTVGIFSQHFNGTSLIESNLVYDNQIREIMDWGPAVISNNTIRTSSQGFYLSLLAGDDVELYNNIVWIDSGTGVYVAFGADQGQVYGDNNLYFTASANANVGRWDEVIRPGLQDWQTATGQDLNSIDADPLFIDPDGADNLFGFENGDFGLDDNFELSANSPAIDFANSFAPSTDLLGRARQDDPGTTNGATVAEAGAFEFIGSSLDTSPPTVANTVPAFLDSGTGGSSIDEIVIEFSERINSFDGLAINNYSLFSAGANGVLGDNDDVELGLAPKFVDAMTNDQVRLVIVDGLLADDEYRFIVKGSSGAAIHDTSGLPLDGDDDGTAGGDYVRDFFIGDIPVDTNVDSLVVTRGIQASGGLPELTQSDNVDLSLRRDPLSVLPWVEFELTGHSQVSIPGSFEFVIESAVFARSRVTQIVWLFDFQANQYEQVDSRVASRFDDAVAEIVPAGDFARFVNPSDGEVRSRVRYVSAEQRELFAVNVDQIIWRVGD